MLHQTTGHTMTSHDWRTTYYQQDSDVPFGEWEQKIVREARDIFNRHTERERAIRDQAIRDQDPYYRSPKAERAIREARRVFRAETEEASRLFEETCVELAITGEVGDALRAKWDALAKPSLMIAAE